MIYSREEILAARAEMPKAWKRTARWRMGSEIDTVETSEAVGLSNGGFDWSSQTALGSSANDFDRQALAFARKQVEARLGQRAKRLHGIGTESLMGKLGAMVNGVPTHGALLLLGKSSSDAHMGGLAPRIVLTRYDANGHLYQKMNVRMPFALSIQRLVDTLCGKGGYPEYAVRELLTNAVAHNDYLLRSNIEIVDRRGVLTITNHGTWAKGTPTGALRDDFDSAPMRNPALCRLMVQCGVMDALGVGLFSVQTRLRAHGLPAITFDLGEDTVTARLYASHEAEQTSQTLPPLPHTVPVAPKAEAASAAPGASGNAAADSATGRGTSGASAGTAGTKKPDSKAAASAAPANANASASAVEGDSSAASAGISASAADGKTASDAAASSTEGGGEEGSDHAADDTAATEISGESLFFAQAWGVDSAAIAKQRAAEAEVKKQAEAEAEASAKAEGETSTESEDGEKAAGETTEESGAGETEDDAAKGVGAAQDDRAGDVAADGIADEKATAAGSGAETSADAAAPDQDKGNAAESADASSKPDESDKAVGSDENETDGFTDVIVLRSSEDVSSDELKRLIVPILANGDGMTRSEVVKALRDGGIQAEDSKFARRVGRLLDQLHKAGVIRKGNPDKRHWYAA